MGVHCKETQQQKVWKLHTLVLVKFPLTAFEYVRFCAHGVASLALLDDNTQHLLNMKCAPMTAVHADFSVVAQGKETALWHNKGVRLACLRQTAQVVRHLQIGLQGLAVVRVVVFLQNFACGSGNKQCVLAV